MSAPFRRDPFAAAAAGSPDDPARWTAGGRLDVPLRMAAGFEPTLDQSPTCGERIVLEESSDPPVRLILDAVLVCSNRSVEGLVADAIDRRQWTVAPVKAARDRRRRDTLWKAAVEAAQRAKA